MRLMSGYIPATYVVRRIAQASDVQRKLQLLGYKDKEEIIDELIDRFGEIPQETLNLVDVSHIRAMAEALGISRIHEESQRVVFEF